MNAEWKVGRSIENAFLSVGQIAFGVVRQFSSFHEVQESNFCDVITLEVQNSVFHFIV